MNSRLTRRFRRGYRTLPASVCLQARQAYRRWRENPNHPGLRFKQVSEPASLYSVRVNQDYRAVGVLEGDTMYWDFIGNHAEYMRYLADRPRQSSVRDVGQTAYNRSS